MRHCIGRPSGASVSARTNCTARDSVSLGMAAKSGRPIAAMLGLVEGSQLLVKLVAQRAEHQVGVL